MTIHTFENRTHFCYLLLFLPKMRTKTHVITFVPGIINRLMMKSAHTFIFFKKKSLLNTFSFHIKIIAQKTHFPFYSFVQSIFVLHFFPFNSIHFIFLSVSLIVVAVAF